MPATAHNLRDLHDLHQRARALRDRLSSGPKTLASKQAALAKRQSDLEAARKALLEGKATLKRKEGELKGLQEKVDDLRGKLNVIKKQVEYDAIRNQIAHDNGSIAKLEEEILQLMVANDDKTTGLATQEADFKVFERDVAALQSDLQAKAAGYQTQLAELDAAIVDAEEIIHPDHREQYRRNVKGRGPDALSPVEHGACGGCFVSVTAQMMNHLIMCDELVFCKTCGRLLYLTEEAGAAATRASRT